MRQASLIAAFVVSFTVACGSETPSIEGGAAGGGAPSSGGFGGGASPPAAAPRMVMRMKESGSGRKTAARAQARRRFDVQPLSGPRRTS